jgi:hypothetical protein
MKPLESDWKTYNKLVPLVRDRFLLGKNAELIAILSQESKTPTETFWEAKSLMDEQAEILSQCLGHHSRSHMWLSVLLLRRYGLIRDQDLEQFSESFRQEVIKGSDVAKMGAE